MYLPCMAFRNSTHQAGQSLCVLHASGGLVHRQCDSGDHCSVALLTAQPHNQQSSFISIKRLSGVM